MKTSIDAELIHGGSHSDQRGIVSYVNDFDMSTIKRFYITSNLDTKIVRAWQGHKYESKWFYCLSGAYHVRLIKIDNWENPSIDLPVENYNLSGNTPGILFIPKGYINGFKALENNSKLLIFSNFTLQESVKDTFRFDTDVFKWNDI